MDYAAKLDRLRAGTLAPGVFGHTDHIGIAYEALSRHDAFEAAQIIASGIRAMAERAGAVEKFNATITLAYVCMIAERMHSARYQDAEDFLRRNGDLADRGVLSQWYSQGRLTSPLARSIPLLPDRAPGAAVTA